MINKLLEESEIDLLRPVGRPIEEMTVRNSAASEPLDVGEHIMYRSITASLMYIGTQTTPDLLVVASMMASYLHKPMKSHIVAANRALRYLNGTEKIENST